MREGRFHHIIATILTRDHLFKVERGVERGHTALALAELDEAKHNYDVSYGKLHPNHGDLLVNRAAILAKVGRRAEAVADCAAGIAILDKTLGPDAAFTKANVKICARLPGAAKS